MRKENTKNRKETLVVAVVVVAVVVVAVV
jgi:hypothetical protein